MNHIKRETIYFETAGSQNTETVLKSARKYVEEAGVKDVVVASTTGETGVQASKMFGGLNLVVVTHHSGFLNLGEQELKEEKRQEAIANGATILTATHALSGVERAIRKKFGTIGPTEIAANTLRLFGEGTKVCVEIVLMATDAGLIAADRNVVAVAGSGRGADTALLVKSANSSRFFNLEVKEVIAKPRALTDS